MAVLGVVGASGGVGASTFACALGLAAGRAGMHAAVVDGAAEGGGVQVTAAVEHVAGYRWFDLIDVDGASDGEALLASLPMLAGCAFVSAGPGPGAPVGLGEEVPAEALRSVCGALAEVCGLVVVDWGRPADPVGVLPGDPSAGIVLMARVSARGVADAKAWVDRHPSVQLAGLVARGGRRDVELAAALAAALGQPLLGHLPDEPGVVRAAESGAAPGGRRGPLRRLAENIALAVVPQ